MRASLSIFILSICSVLQGAESSTNLLSIHLVDTKLFDPWPELNRTNLGIAKLISPPAIADSDFMAYNTNRHTFTLRAEAAERLAKSIWKLGWGEVPHVHQSGDYELIPAPAPFVLKAFGKPVYAGAFYTSVSSDSFRGPVIMAEEMFIKTNVPRNKTFSFSIELGYGAVGGIPDPRGDPHILSAVRNLFAEKK